MATEEFIAKATVIGIEQLDRLAAALERVQGAGAGSATAATADAIRASRVQEEVGQQFQRNAQLAEQFGTSSRTAATALSNAMRQTKADVTTTILAMERLKALQQTVGAGLKQAAPTPTANLAAENAFLQSQGTRAQIARAQGGGFVGIVDGQTTDVQRTREAAARAAIEMDGRLTAAKARELEATLAGLSVAAEQIEADRRAVAAKRESERAARREAAAADKNAAASEKLAAVKQAGSGAEVPEPPNAFRPDTEQLQAAIATVDAEARRILDAEVPGGGAAANRDQIQDAYYRAMQAATPVLQEKNVPGLVNATAQAVEGLQGNAARLNESTGRLHASATALNNRWITQLQAPYTPTPLAGGGVVPPPGGGGIRGAFGGFADDFATGFRGRGELPFAQQFGQVAKFSVFYGAAYNALFAISQAMQTAVDEAVRYNAALVDLAIATNSSQDAVSGLADSLGRTVSAYGLSPAAGAEIGTRAVGVFDLNNVAVSERDFQTEAFAKAVAQLNFVTGRDVNQITEDLGAIAQAFDVGAAQVSRIQDLDAYFSRRFGSQQGGTIETVAQIGSIGESAGFTLEEVTALASKLQSRTGQTPQAVAGLLSQFLGRSGDPALAEKLSQLGIDVTQGFKDQIRQLGQADLSDRDRLFIENAFGRGRSGQAASIIIQDFQEITRAARQANEEAAGLGEEQTAERMATVGGALQKLLGDLQQLAVDFGNSGLLDILYVAIKALDAFVVGIDNFLQIWNQMPRALRDVIIGLTALAIATKYAAASQTVQSILRPGPGLGNVLAPFGKAGAASLTQAAPAATGLAGVASRTGAAVTALTGMSVATLATTAGLAALAIGAAEAYVQIKNHEKALRDANDAYTVLAGAETATDFQDAADTLNKQADTTDNAQGFLLNAITFGGAEREADAVVERLRASADFAEQAGEYAAAQDKINAALEDVGVFGDPAVATIEDFSSGITALEQQGASAVTQMRLLADAIRIAGENSETTAGLLYDPERQANEFAADLVGGVAAIEVPRDDEGVATGRLGQLAPTITYPLVGAYGTAVENTRELNDSEIQDIVQQRLTAAGLDERTIVEMYLEQFGDKAPTQEEQRAFLDQILTEAQVPFNIKPFVLAALSRNMKDFFEANDPNRRITPEELIQLVEGNSTFPGLVAIGQSALDSLSAQGYDEGTAQYQEQLRINLQALRDAAQDTKGPTPERIADQIRAAAAAVARGAITRLEGMREVAQASADSAQEFREIGRSFLRRELRRAVRSGDIRLISEVIGRSSNRVINNVRGVIVLELETAKAAYAAARKAVDYVKIGRRLVSRASAAALEALRVAAKEVQELQAQLDALDASAKITVPEATALQPPSELTDAGTEDDGPTQAQIDAARAIAAATRRGGEIALATAQLQSARADLAAAEEGTVEYYQALAAVYEAQRSLAEAIRDDRINKYLLANDITDPVVQAKAELKRARQQLRYDQRNNASPELIREDRRNLQEQQANFEATKFQAWLSALQTAENLDRISHAAYIRHLERRKERLESIRNRTKQEQDQLDQVDAALKAAKESMSGQFNIGDIKVPTPYEVRRYIEQTAAAARSRAQQATGNEPRVTPSSQQAAQTTNNNINIDGADTAQIIRILRDILGNNAIKSTATKTGKR